MLQLDHLRLRQTGFALDADWSLPKGSRLAVIGPSGAGKSSLLMAIAGFLAPVQGHIRWEGAEFTTLPPAGRPVSILFQDQNLFPHLTLVQNLGLALSPRLKLDAAQRRRIDQVLDRLGLAGLGQRRPGDISGGQQGRAALGRVLLQARPLLLLDEPFAALGPALKADLLSLVKEMATEAGTTVLLVTHNPQDARSFADLTVVVADGIATAPAQTLVLLADPPPALAAYLGPDG